MTFDDWFTALYVKRGFVSGKDELREAWEAATKSAHEACAKLCDGMRPAGGRAWDAAQAAAFAALSDAAKAIRCPPQGCGDVDQSSRLRVLLVEAGKWLQPGEHSPPELDELHATITAELAR